MYLPEYTNGDCSDQLMHLILLWSQLLGFLVTCIRTISSNFADDLKVNGYTFFFFWGGGGGGEGNVLFPCLPPHGLSGVKS